MNTTMLKVAAVPGLRGTKGKMALTPESCCKKIQNVKVPPKSKWARMPQPEGEEEEEPEAEDYEGNRTGGRRRNDGKSRSKAGTSTRRMKRVESSPAAF